MTAPTTVAELAASIYQTRQRTAQTVVRNRGMSIAEAERHLRPWLAIACIAGASLPEIDELIADLEDMSRASKHSMSPGAIRWLAAEEICPRSTWAPLLTKARNQAFDRFLEADAEPARSTAVSLQKVCLALQHDVNGHRIPAYRHPSTRNLAMAA